MVAAETGRPWRGRPILTDNPSRGCGEFCQLLSVASHLRLLMDWPFVGPYALPRS